MIFHALGFICYPFGTEDTGEVIQGVTDPRKVMRVFDAVIDTMIFVNIIHYVPFRIKVKQMLVEDPLYFQKERKMQEIQKVMDDLVQQKKLEIDQRVIKPN